jgi:quinol monooxygenase YgiN
MISVIAIVRAKPGKGAELEADFRAWAEVVKAKEPGTLQYTLNRSTENPDLYYAIEAYADDAAVAAHMANFQARGGGPDVAVGPPEIIVLERVVG